jgi:O-antigen/teichoic acid export membrane protein
VKLREHVGRAGQLVAVACAGQVVSWVIYIVLAHRTGVSEFEDYAVAVGAVTLLASFTTLGLEKYAVRILPVFYERGDWANARGFVGFALRRTFWISIAGGAALALGWGWRDPGSASWAAVAVAMLILPVVSLVQLAVEALTAAGHELRGVLVYRIGVPGAALAMVLLALELPLALSGAAAVACWGLGWGLALAGMAREVRRLTPPGVWASPPRVETGWQREALPFLGYGLALNTIGQAGVLGLEFLGASEVDLGAYAAAAQTTGLVVVLATATNRFYAPRLSILLERGDFASIENVRRQRVLWVAPLVAAFLVAALGFGRELLEIFRPEFVEDGVPVLRVLACSAGFSVLFSMAPTYLQYSRRNRLVLGTTGGAAAVQVLLLFALVPSLGATGAAIAYAVAMVGMYAVFVAVAHRELVALRAKR